MRRFTDFLQLAAVFKPAKAAPETTPIPPAIPAAPPAADTWSGRNAWRQEPPPTPPKPAQPEPQLGKKKWLKLLADQAARDAARAEADKLRESLANQTRQLNALKADLKAVKALLTNLAQTLQEPTSPPPSETPPPPPGTLLQTPAAFSEAFPGELRELLLDTLQSARDNAQSCGRARRQAALEAILQANPSMGELARRQNAVRQILKDAGRFNDGTALEPLGFILDGGGKHWKLRYANLTHSLPKTPSDYRSNLNAAAELINRFL